MPAVSPLAPAEFPALPAVAGVRLGAAVAGVHYRGRRDLLLATFAPDTAVAGVLTRSQTAAAPVQWCRAALAGGRASALVVNAGNANAFTGAPGVAAVKRTARAAARLVGGPAGRVFIASTGVIGEPLADARIARALPALHARLVEEASGNAAWEDAARAIMTTDTYAKGATRRARIGGVSVTINGIAKGSGMIAPDMATMLAFIFTDARLPAPLLQTMLRRANGRSFNAITVDGDTSTSDTCLLFASGAGAAHPAIRRAGDPRLKDFRAQLEALMVDLAQQIVRDGEGAGKFVAVTVSGAASEPAARRLAFAVANSPLVKTAIAGEDPNWGRIVMALGKAGPALDQSKLAIRIGGVPVARGGRVHPDYREAAAARHMKGREIEIAVSVGRGRGRATVWTCDLSHGYVEINADYRT